MERKELESNEVKITWNKCALTQIDKLLFEILLYIFSNATRKEIFQLLIVLLFLVVLILNS